MSPRGYLGIKEAASVWYETFYTQSLLILSHDGKICILRETHDRRLLQFGILLPPFLSNLLLGKPPRLALQHLYLLFERELHLVAHRDQTLRNVLVVLPEQVDREKEVIDVVEDNRVFVRILLFLR
jgi:hypothetical protein